MHQCSTPYNIMIIGKFKYIFKTDDDQEVLNERFFEMVQGLIERRNRPNYGGKIINVLKPYFSMYNRIHPELPPDLPILTTTYCSGRFYFLSFNAVQNLIQKKNLFATEYLEDYAVGYHLDEQLKEDTLDIQSDRFLNDFDDILFNK